MKKLNFKPLMLTPGSGKAAGLNDADAFVKSFVEALLPVPLGALQDLSKVVVPLAARKLTVLTLLARLLNSQPYLTCPAGHVARRKPGPPLLPPPTAVAPRAPRCPRSSCRPASRLAATPTTLPTGDAACRRARPTTRSSAACVRRATAWPAPISAASAAPPPPMPTLQLSPSLGGLPTAAGRSSVGACVLDSGTPQAAIQALAASAQPLPALVPAVFASA